MGEQGPSESCQVAGLAAGFPVVVPHDFPIHPMAAGLADIVSDGLNTGLELQGWPVAGSGSGCTTISTEGCQSYSPAPSDTSRAKPDQSTSSRPLATVVVSRSWIKLPSGMATNPSL